jgi:hypothetical protein
MATAYQKIPVPGYTSPTSEATDPEILYSYAGFTQKGVTLGANQGILPAGTLLGRKTADKKYYVYNNGASDGTEVARGVLRRAADTAGGDQLGNIVIAGILKLSMVSGADSAALTDLGAVTDSVRGTFKL